MTRACPRLPPTINPWVDVKINLRFNPCSDDRACGAADDDGMTTTDYLINGLFVLVVLRQSRERVLDRRSIVVPLVLVFFIRGRVGKEFYASEGPEQLPVQR